MSRADRPLQLAAVLLPALLALAAPEAAWAQRRAITIATSTQLSFGTVTWNRVGGTVTVSAAGVRTVTGGVVALTGGTIQAASFAITGANNTAYTITLPASTTLTRAGGGSMPISFSPSLVTGGTLVRTLAGGGRDNFSVGAVLTIAAGQLPGAYSGAILMTVNY